MCEYITFLWDDCCVSTLVCHDINIYVHNVLCHVLAWKKTGLKWNPGTTRGTRRREGGSDYVRISLLWLISASLSPSCCLWVPLCLFKAWLHQFVTRWKLLKNGCYGSLPPQDASVISAIQMQQAAERHCRSISDYFDGDCIILLSSRFFSPPCSSVVFAQFCESRARPQPSFP